SLLPAHLGMAKAVVSLGRIDEDVEDYRRMVPLAPGARLGVAQTLVTKQLALPSARRNWTEADQALQEASGLKPEPFELPLLRAEALAAQGKPGARDILEKALGKEPKRVELWTALAALTDLEGKGERVPALLDETQAKLGDRVEIRLARATYWSKRPGDVARKELAR